MGKRYWHLDFDEVGYNYRMTDAQAAVGLVQLRKLDAFNCRRMEIANRYQRELAGIPGLRPPRCRRGRETRLSRLLRPRRNRTFPCRKDDFMWELYTAKQIKVWSHYMPIHLTTAYRNLGHTGGECPVAEQLFQHYVSLPIHPRLTSEAIDYLFASIKELA